MLRTRYATLLRRRMVQVQLQQLGEQVVVGEVGEPAEGCEDRFVEAPVGQV